ncbi:pyoverdine dityrosine biosynthesis [Achaetomium macrosporum]|uniref:Pyoverdine dityrosine biosynthesis n=1 Tax=Achaetomium macrosporum TaxID=79813 RepID=A0AAN7C210_9PEZI|nr:pyoverdine dityrosine biosynthesis [Achaetomium macrosporum]
MAVTMPTSSLKAESAMDLEKQLSYEKRLAELESQIQDLQTWKKAILATLAVAIRPTTPALSRRKTVDVVPLKRKSSARAAQNPTDDFLPRETVPATTLNSPIVAEPEEVRCLPLLAKIREGVELSASHIVAHRIMDVLETYGRHTQSGGGDDHKWLGRDKFFPRVEQYVRRQQPVKMILPSFPWKSVNRVDKVIGALPDLGEELALARLNAICVDIGKIYPRGAEIHIATDGLAFNDVVGISDEDTWEYSVALMDMAAKKGFTGIKLLRVMDFLGYTDPSSPLTKDQYLSLIAQSRAELESQFGSGCADQSVRHMIETDHDTLMTYRGFIRFLETDLRHSPVAAHARSGQHYRRIVKEAAMKMMVRAEAFTKIIQAKCPDYVRLSIHPSSGAAKLSVPLLVEKSAGCGFPRTPWHSTIAVGLDGAYRAVHAKDVRETHELVMKDGRPWCFRECSDLFDLGDDVDIEHLYPCGVEIRPRAAWVGDARRLGRGAMEKVRRLAMLQPVRLVGFADITPLPK